MTDCKLSKQVLDIAFYYLLIGRLDFFNDVSEMVKKAAGLGFVPNLEELLDFIARYELDEKENWVDRFNILYKTHSLI